MTTKQQQQTETKKHFEWTLGTFDSSGRAYFTAEHMGTRYWLEQFRNGWWQVTDSHGAAWGLFETAADARAAVENL